MFYLHLTPCRSNHTEGPKGPHWGPQKRSPLSIPCSISPSSWTNVKVIKRNLVSAFFYRMINECAENCRLNVLTNFLWEIIATLSQQFATVPSCAYASCQSEKVQMLLVPGGLVNRLHRLSPSCYSFCLAPPSLRLTVCACCRSTRGYIFSARPQTVTCDPPPSVCLCSCSVCLRVPF